MSSGIGLDFDFHELFDFGNYISNPANVTQLLELTMTDLAQTVLDKLVYNTKTYDYRGWSKTGNSETGTGLVGHWRSDNKNLRAKVVKVSGGYSVTLVNHAHDAKEREYGSWVEEDTKWATGRFFMSETEVHFNNSTIELTAVTEKRFREFIERATKNG